MNRISGILILIWFICGSCPAQSQLPAAPGNPANTPKEIVNSIGMKLILIEPGEFGMGAQPGEPARDDEHLHHVRISKAFYLGIYDVTVSQFRAFVAGMAQTSSAYRTNAERGGQESEAGKPGGYRLTNTGEDAWKPKANWHNPGWKQAPDHPVVFISWEDAQSFVTWLSKKESRSYRLPTEAEWEYACRGGTDTAYWWGNKPDTTGTVANVADRSFKRVFPNPDINFMNMNDHFVYTSPAGRYKANGFGLYDMIGDAWEWVEDYYDPNLTEATDPKGPVLGIERVARGGGWGTPPDRCRCAARFHDPPTNRYAGTSFRIALDIP